MHQPEWKKHAHDTLDRDMFLRTVPVIADAFTANILEAAKDVPKGAVCDCITCLYQCRFHCMHAVLWPARVRMMCYFHVCRRM